MKILNSVLGDCHRAPKLASRTTMTLPLFLVCNCAPYRIPKRRGLKFGYSSGSSIAFEMVTAGLFHTSRISNGLGLIRPTSELLLCLQGATRKRGASVCSAFRFKQLCPEEIILQAVLNCPSPYVRVSTTVSKVLCCRRRTTGREDVKNTQHWVTNWLGSGGLDRTFPGLAG
jgi:hypothetical protein